MLSRGVFMLPFCEKGVLKSPRLRSNESPSGAFKRQSGLRKQMEGLCPDKLRRLFRTPKFKIYFPLMMRRANAARIQMVFFLGYTKVSRRYTATRYAAMKHQMMGSHRMTAL